MRQVTQHLMVFSFLFGCSCANVPRPDTDLCINNVPAHDRKCYNMLRDYDDSGNLSPSAKPTYKSLDSLNDINKHLDVDIKGIANLKAYLNNLRNAAKQSCQ